MELDSPLKMVSSVIMLSDSYRRESSMDYGSVAANIAVCFLFVLLIGAGVSYIIIRSRQGWK